MRALQFINREHYHIFNRGVDKRIIFSEQEDIDRFFQSIKAFNTLNPIGSIYEHSFKEDKLGSLASKLDKLVNFICYCLNSNHYHFILEQLTDNGIEKLMHRLGTGYTNYFNNKYDRSGSLFQGTFKAVHINSNEYLLHLSAYVNLNDKIHEKLKLGSLAPKSSWDEYTNKNTEAFCSKDIILGQFKNRGEYKKFAKTSLEWIKENKEATKFLLE